MVKALRSCLEAAKGKIKAGHLIPQKKPQENSYRIFYSLKYIPYTHSTYRIYSLLVPGILESRMSQETASYWQSPLRGRNCPKTAPLFCRKRLNRAWTICDVIGIFK